MENFLFPLLLLLLISPFVLILAGIVMLFNKKPEIKTRGKYFLLGGFLILLIGFAICTSSFKF